MKWLVDVFATTLLAGLSALPALAQSSQPVQPPRIILVGDSTMATRTGYGDALCQLFTADVTCINLARGGRSSSSFRAEGLWGNVLSLLRNSEQPTYVLIQFGHNDQPGKPGRSTDLGTEFPANMARYVDEVKGLGGVPVLVTPLTRRSFSDGLLQNDLSRWADATRAVAASKSELLIDLNAKSYAAVALMGSTEADTLAEEPPPKQPALAVNDTNKTEPNGMAKSRFDYTHLGAKGAALFSKMVAREWVQKVPKLSTNFRADVLN